MQFSVETTQGLERRLSFTIPADQIDVEVKDRLKRLAKTQRIDGFRPGKVPVSVIQKRYGNAVRQEVAGESMQRNFVDAIVKEKLNPAGTPRFEATKNESGADLEFVATFEVYPEIEVADLAKMSVEKPVVEIKDKDLNNMMKTLQKQHGEWTEVKRKIKKTDKVTINFTGTIDGEAFEGGTAEDFVLELGQNKMIPGFEDSIIGAKTGEEVVSDVTFPEDYHAENLKGKAAQFTITITKTEELKLPKVDEEFAKLFGIESGDVEELKAEVSNNMTRELEQKLKAVVKEQVLNALIEANDIEIPKSLIDQEIDALRNQAIERYTGGQSGANVPELPAELFAENAKRRVSIGLLLGEVIKSNEIKVDEDRVKALIETMASAYEDPQEVVDYYYNNKELLQQMHHVAMEEQAIETILEKAKVKEVKKSFDDVMNKQ